LTEKRILSKVRKKRKGQKVSQEVEDQTERQDHLGIVAGVCQEAGLAEWLDKQAGKNGRSVSIGTATVAMVLNGLGFSNRQLYLVPQYFENKPVEHLLGEGISADMLNDDCLGCTLDWLYEHDVTTLFAGLARPRPSSLRHSSSTPAHRYDLVLGEWRLCHERGG
jgi:hypothetical protein